MRPITTQSSGPLARIRSPRPLTASVSPNPKWSDAVRTSLLALPAFICCRWGVPHEAMGIIAGGPSWALMVWGYQSRSLSILRGPKAVPFEVRRYSSRSLGASSELKDQ
jgi:hypothetical protein